MRNLVFIILFLPLVTLSQELSYEEYMANVLTNHPLAIQANLELEYAEIASLKARGELDPKIYANHGGKEFKNKEYYNLTTSEIKVPTRYGVQFKVGYDRTSGDNYNPQSKTDENGLWRAGIEVDVLQGLLVNERSTALDLAKVYESATQVQRDLMLNELLYKASKQYLEWSTNYQALQIIEQNIQLAEQYVENTVTMVEFGDKPSIALLEAQTNLTTQLTTKTELYANYVQSKWLTNQYLWQNGARVELLERVVPQTQLKINTNKNVRQQQNLFLQEKEFKLQHLEVERKLAKENVKPRLQLGYYPLFATKSNVLPTATPKLSNLKYGASFSMPLFRQKAKAELAKLDVKQNQTVLEIKNKRNELETKQQALLAKMQAYEEQYTTTKELLSQTKELLTGEATKFNYGESSVFLLNKRQEKVIATELKLIKIQQKIIETQLKYQYYTNGFLLN